MYYNVWYCSVLQYRILDDNVLYWSDDIILYYTIVYCIRSYGFRSYCM